MKHFNYFSAMTLFFTLFFASPVHAYIDPGSGSYILQLLIAALFGILFTVKVFWRNVKMFVLKLFSKDLPDQNADKERN